MFRFLASQLLQISWDTCMYWGSFMFFWWWRQPIGELEVFGAERLPLCHMYTLAKTMLLWDAPHYRATTFAADLRGNLKNVAVPGTGIPLSVFCWCKASALVFILVVNPAMVFVAAVCHTISCAWRSFLKAWQCQLHSGPNSSQHEKQQMVTLADAYRQMLLFPDNWFAVWRHNCLLVGYHALVTGSSTYRMENKGTFLLEGQRLGLPVSPFYSDATVFVKHINVEGGMGIHVFKNFAQGGEWVIQRALTNHAELSRMLPPGAPLSTVRVVTSSSVWLQQQAAPDSRLCSTATWRPQQQEVVGSSSVDAPAHKSSSMPSSPVSSLSRGNSSSSSGLCGGQATGCATPDLPLSAGVVQQSEGGAIGGAPNGNIALQTPCASNSSSLPGPHSSGPEVGAGRWGNEPVPRAQARQQQAQDGGVGVVTAVWRAGLAGKDTDHSSICFPLDLRTGVLSEGVSSNHWYKLGLQWLGRVDSWTYGRSWVQHPDSGVQVSGSTIPDLDAVIRKVVHAHLIVAQDVPLVGWDVALTPGGVYLLEVNLSCNLFNGHFDSKCFYEHMFLCLDALDKCNMQGGHVKTS